jgi:regulatory protein
MEFSEEMQEEAMEALGESDRALDRRAAALYVRKRKFGPYKDEKTRNVRREKELASLARKGFSYDIANSIINAEDIEEIETLIYGELIGKNME